MMAPVAFALFLSAPAGRRRQTRRWLAACVLRSRCSRASAEQDPDAFKWEQIERSARRALWLAAPELKVNQTLSVSLVSFYNHPAGNSNIEPVKQRITIKHSIQ